MKVILDEIREYLTSNETCRVFHGRGGVFQDYGHITVDWFHPILYVRFFEEDAQEKELCETLFREFKHPVVLHKRYNNTFDYFGLNAEDVADIKALEFDLSYNLRIGQNQNPGFFLDMKEGRRWLKNHSQDKKVLNLFAYTCSLSVVAKAFGATEVHNVDVSSSFLSWGRDNHRLNDLSLEGINFHKKDVLKSLNWLAKKGPYDIVIYDPPSFQKSRFEYKKDYKKVVNSMEKLVAPGGYILSCLNSPFEKTDFIVNLYKEKTKEFEFIETLHSPAEFREVDKEDGVKICIFKRL